MAAQNAPGKSARAPEKRSVESRFRFSTAVLVFIGTLLGSLIGAAADLGDAADTLQRLRRLAYPELCVAGSNTILGEGIEVAADWKNEFERVHEARVTIDGIGSVRGVQKAVEGGCVHILAMSEPIPAPQYNALLAAGIEIDCAAEIGFDVIAFVTDINNPVQSINIRDLGNVLNGKISVWGQIDRVRGGSRPIYILARPGSGTTDFVLSNIARYTDPDISDDQYFPPNTNYLVCKSNDECLDFTLSTPGSLYWVSSAWMRTQPPEYLRVIPILESDEAPVNPLTQDVDLEQYPARLIRPLYFYVLSGPKIAANVNALARQFLLYVRSVRGQQVLEKYAFYTHFSKPAEIRIPLPVGFEIPTNGPRTICRPQPPGAS